MAFFYIILTLFGLNEPVAARLIEAFGYTAQRLIISTAYSSTIAPENIVLDPHRRYSALGSSEAEQTLSLQKERRQGIQQRPILGELAGADDRYNSANRSEVVSYYRGHRAMPYEYQSRDDDQRSGRFTDEESANGNQRRYRGTSHSVQQPSQPRYFDKKVNQWIDRGTGKISERPKNPADLVYEGRVSLYDIDAWARQGALPNKWMPNSEKFPKGGFKYSSGHYTVHGHGINPVAVEKFPNSNAAKGPTATITDSTNAQTFRTDGTWGSFRSNPEGAHIPLDDSPY